jgi:hypothetical protein
MFICESCLDDFEGPAIDVAKYLILLRGSHGPCEICRKTNICADVPSYADFRIKKEKEKS